MENQFTFNDYLTRPKPHFDGDDYNANRDHKRLTGQAERIWRFMSDGIWHSLEAISKATDAPQASVSAQLRNLRKERFGGWTIERRHIGSGLYHYRMVI